jgi:hypothetical protein
MRKSWSPDTVHRTTLSLLIAIVVLLCVDFARLTKTESSSDEADLQALVMWRNAPPEGKTFLEKQYETVVAEIRQRIEEEHLIFALKFALVGGILYAAVQRILSRDQGTLERTPATALVTWAAVVVAAVVDWRISGNQSILSALGAWVGRYEKVQLGAAAGLGWEAFLAKRAAHPAVRLSGQMLTALLFAFSGAVFLTRRKTEDDPTTTALSRTCATVSISLMTATAVMFRGPWAWAHAFLGLLGVWLIFRLTRLSDLP